MTRAREKLIMVYAGENTDSTCEKYAAGIPVWKSKFSPHAVSGATGYGEWLISTLLRHPYASDLRAKAETDNSAVLPAKSPVKIVLTEYQGRSDTAESEEISVLVDENFKALIKERSDFKYKYEALSGIVTKRAASETDKNFIDRDYFASSVPAFLSESGLTGAARGVATHTFIQYADYVRAKESVSGEIERLREKGILTEAEAECINVSALEKFFSSSLFDRIQSSELVMREKKFTIEVPVSDVYEGMEKYCDEMIMIQGIADCAFFEDGKLVVVDYKTDRLSHEDMFREKYASQVLIYKKALKMATGYDVKETLLYSFHLGKEIKVEG
jgi:ATP-dependent helicase/nuclease subunit A